MTDRPPVHNLRFPSFGKKSLKFHIQMKPRRSKRISTRLNYDDCSICYEEKVSPYDLLHCKHPVCFSCLHHIVSPYCPICRSDLKGPLIHPKLLKSIHQRYNESIEKDKKCDRIRDAMASRGALILEEYYDIDQFDGIEFTRQSLRDCNPLLFTSPPNRSLPVSYVIDYIMNDEHYNDLYEDDSLPVLDGDPILDTSQRIFIFKIYLRFYLDKAFTLINTDLSL